MDIIFDQSDREWLLLQMERKLTYWKIVVELMNKTDRATADALQRGDTEFEKGRVSGLSELLELTTRLTVPDTPDTGTE
jgi:hypothetical protein